MAFKISNVLLVEEIQEMNAVFMESQLLKTQNHSTISLLTV